MALLRKILAGLRRNGNLQQKLDWEFEWQSTQWASVFKDPENQRKCHEYWVRFRHLDDIRKRVPLDDTTNILDVGCGISTVLHYLPGRRHGIDPLAERYKTIYEYPKDIDIQEGSGESIQFPDRHFDLVTCSNCIDHTQSPTDTVAEIERVLRPGGHLVLTCEAFPTDLGERNAAHPHSMTIDSLRTLTKRFETIEHWDEPWYGLLNYVLGNPPTTQREQILLLRKPL